MTFLSLWNAGLPKPSRYYLKIATPKHLQMRFSRYKPVILAARINIYLIKHMQMTKPDITYQHEILALILPQL